MSSKKTRIMYVEQKTDGIKPLNDKGPSEVVEITFSRSYKTIYYKDKTFKRIHGGGIYGNYLCLNDNNEYWISGVKKKGSNRL